MAMSLGLLLGRHPPECHLGDKIYQKVFCSAKSIYTYGLSKDIYRFTTTTYLFLRGWFLLLRLRRSRREEAFLQLFPGVEVLFRKLAQGAHGRLLHHFQHLVLETLLLVDEGPHAALKVSGQEILHRAAVEADQLLQQLRRKQRPAGLLALHDDLQQDAAREVFAGLGVLDADLVPGDDRLADLFQREVAALGGVVEPAVGVFPYDAFFHDTHHAGALSPSEERPPRVKRRPARRSGPEPGLSPCGSRRSPTGPRP